MLLPEPGISCDDDRMKSTRQTDEGVGRLSEPMRCGSISPEKPGVLSVEQMSEGTRRREAGGPV